DREGPASVVDHEGTAAGEGVDHAPHEERIAVGALVHDAGELVTAREAVTAKVEVPGDVPGLEVLEPDLMAGGAGHEVVNDRLERVLAHDHVRGAIRADHE